MKVFVLSVSAEHAASEYPLSLLQQSASTGNWTPEATSLLIKLRTELEEDFLNKTKKKWELWDDITVQLQRAGFPTTRLQAETKWRNMKRRYCITQSLQSYNYVLNVVCCFRMRETVAKIKYSDDSNKSIAVPSYFNEIHQYCETKDVHLPLPLPKERRSSGNKRKLVLSDDDDDGNEPVIIYKKTKSKCKCTQKLDSLVSTMVTMHEEQIRLQQEKIEAMKESHQTQMALLQGVLFALRRNREGE